MKCDFIAARLPFLYKVVAGYVAQHAIEILLLFGLAMFTVALSVATHYTQRGRFVRVPRVLIVHACPSHIYSRSAGVHVEILRQPTTPTAIGDALVLDCVTSALRFDLGEISPRLTKGIKGVGIRPRKNPPEVQRAAARLHLDGGFA